MKRSMLMIYLIKIKGISVYKLLFMFCINKILSKDNRIGTFFIRHYRKNQIFKLLHWKNQLEFREHKKFDSKPEKTKLEFGFYWLCAAVCPVHWIPSHIGKSNFALLIIPKLNERQLTYFLGEKIDKYKLDRL